MKMATNEIAYYELKKVMHLYGDHPSYDLPRIINKSSLYCSRRLGGRSKFSFTLEDAYRFCDYYSIQYDKIPFLFPKGGERYTEGEENETA